MTVKHVGPSLLALFVMTAIVGAQERRQGGPPPYEPSVEKTVTATMGKTFTMPVGEGNLILETTVDGKTMHVIMGPPQYIKEQKFTFKEGTKVEVTGMPGFRVNSEPAMLARKLQAGKETLTLRDESGEPKWKQ